MLNDIINILSEGYDYEDRVVDRFEENNLIVDTSFANDTGLYETGIKHSDYSNEWIIVEEYTTKEEAQKGHDKWRKLMTSDQLPSELRDVSSCEAAGLTDDAKDDEDWRICPRRTINA